MVLSIGPSGTTKDTYRIFFEVTIFQHEMVNIMSVRHMWDMECKKGLGWKTEGLSTQRREPPFLINEKDYICKWISAM